MDNIARDFNSLPRPEKTPTGLPNHCVFTVRHVPLEPQGDLVFAVHPRSHFVLSKGPAQILTSDDHAVRAEALVPHLLKAFIDAHVNPSTGRAEGGVQATSPWTWATDDVDLAKAVSSELKQHGVTEALCSVGTCSTEEKDVLKENWSRLVGSMMKMMGRDARSKKDLATALEALSLDNAGGPLICYGCLQDSTALSAPLKKCGACGKAWYCSTECQKKDWKEHKAACRRPTGPASASSSGTRPSSVDAFTYYNTIAHTVAEAKALAKVMNLSLPTSNRTSEGTMRPVRRLIITGNDTPENLQLLFGPNWQRTIKSSHEEARIDVLLNPPRGSPSYAMTANAGLDNGAPAWSPRPANDAELRKVTEVKEMQTRVRQHLGVRKEPDGSDMQAILTTFGPAWVERLAPVHACDQHDGPGRKTIVSALSRDARVVAYKTTLQLLGRPPLKRLTLAAKIRVDVIDIGRFLRLTEG